MKKLNSKGFVLTETLIVSVLLITTLITVYTQFKSINRRNKESFIYNSIPSLYKINNLKKYLEQENYYSYLWDILSDGGIVELDACEDQYFNEPEYCKTVMENSGIVSLFVLPENLYPIINRKYNYFYSINPFYSTDNNNLIRYLKTIDYKDGNGAYLVGYFNDGSFANVKIFTDDKYAMELNNQCNPRILINYEITFVDSNRNQVLSPYKNSIGCGTPINVEDIIEKEIAKSGNTCLVAKQYPTYVYVYPYSPNNNTFEILMGKKPSQVVVEYKDLTGANIFPATTLELSCGDLVNPTSYIRQIEGYEYVKSNVGETVLDGTNLTITLSYNGG